MIGCEFSCRLKDAIEKNGLTQKQFAEIMGVSEVTISRYVTENRYPSIDRLAKICRHLGVSADYLLGLSEENEY